MSHIDKTFSQTLAQVDPEIQDVLDKELGRQRGTLEMIASENFVPHSVLEAQGSVLTNKYAEGYPGSATTVAASLSTSQRTSRLSGPRSSLVPRMPTFNPILVPVPVRLCCTLLLSPVTRFWVLSWLTAATSLTA